MTRATFEKKAAKEFSQHGKEQMTATTLAGSVYGFGSEVATLRCAQKYKNFSGIRHGYSAPRQTYYFAYDISIQFDE